MRPRLPWIIALLVVLAGGGWLVWRLVLRDTATPVSAADVVDEAVRGASTTAPPTTAHGGTTATSEAAPTATTSGFVVGEEPGDPGLYRYATTGGEEIDALGGSRHDYPEETFITIQPGGCGSTQRWTALEERWDEVELCATGDGWSVVRYDAFHKWFGQSDLQAFSCGPPDAVAAPTGASGSWVYECTNDARAEVWTVAVVGAEQVDVGPDTVAAIHVRVTSVLSGDSDGESETDTWYLEGTSLVLRRIVTRSSANASPIGAVHYSERYEIVLVAMRPEGEQASGG